MRAAACAEFYAFSGRAFPGTNVWPEEENLDAFQR